MGIDYRVVQETLKTDTTAQAQFEQIDGIVREAMTRFLELDRSNGMAPATRRCVPQ
jgi:hypothetical protein